MVRSKKLAPVVEHAEKNEQSALQAVASSQQRLNQQQLQLEQLLQYRVEYIERRDNGNTSFGVVQFREFNRFLAQLDDTIEQQKRIVEAANREVQMKTRQWKLDRSRSDAMHKVVDRLQAQEVSQEARQEQKILDEIALRGRLKNS